MTNQGMWQKVQHSIIPKGQRCIKSKWVFKIKRNSVFHACLVACSYSQIPSINFTKNYTPVMNDVTWCILLVAMIVWGMDAIIVDMEMAFLYGKLEEGIYINLPEGMEGDDSECLLLLKALYGLMQGAHQWWKKFVKILKNIEFKGSFADLCLLIKQSNNRTIFVLIYVDDNFCIGHQSALNTFVKDLKKQGLSW